MIRKILFGVFCIYLSIWLLVAYAIKSELQDNIRSYDGFNFSYKTINISGFPNKWNFEFDRPVIKSADDYIDINFKNITLTTNLTFTKLTLLASKDIILNFAEEDGEYSYDLSFYSDPKIILKRKNSFFSKDKLYGFISLAMNENILEVHNQEKEILKIDNQNISLMRNVDAGINSFALECDLNYDGINEYFGFSKLKLGALYEIVFGEDQKEQKTFLTSFKSKRFDVIVDEEAELHLSGEIDFARDEFPTGSFTLDLMSFEKLIDSLWGASFDLTTNDIKNMVVKANGNQPSDDVSLPVIFSDKGLIIGATSWQKLKQGD